mmetsp:Transcript_14152/g.24940  ORF Transcript_14152/g.24940 Transcript_14152/m.24940 type:complete len:122 (-) Transcript_14152:107-472(-)
MTSSTPNSTVSEAIAEDSKSPMLSNGTNSTLDLASVMLALRNLPADSDSDTDSEFGDGKDTDVDGPRSLEPLTRTPCMQSLPPLSVVFLGWSEEKVRKYLSDWPEHQIVRLLSEIRLESNL